MGEGCKMCDVLSWRQPATAAASLISFNLLYLLVFGLGKTLLSMTSWVCLSFLGLGLCLRLLGVTNEKSCTSSPSAAGAASAAGSGSGKATGSDGAAGGCDSGVSAAKGEEGQQQQQQQRVFEVISRETMEEHVTAFYGSVNRFLSRTRDIVLWKDWMTSIRCCVAIWAVGTVCSFFSLPVVVFLFVWTAFLYTFGRKLFLDHVKPLVSPHLQTAKLMVVRVISAVPRMDDALNKSKKKV